MLLKKRKHMFKQFDRLSKKDTGHDAMRKRNMYVGLCAKKLTEAHK
jgi:hypothetical protein